MGIKKAEIWSGTYKTGSLPETLSAADITKVMGFEPQQFNDGKVTMEWCATISGQPVAIWDYKGALWSTFDPSGALPALFEKEVA